MSRNQRQRENRELIERLRRDGARIARRFGLRFRSIDAERANVKRRYGICYSDGTIRIRLRHARSGKPLRYSSLVNTLCHELAHLRHFNHGERFKRCYFELLGWSRQQGIYRPARPLPAAVSALGSPVKSPQPPLALPAAGETAPPRVRAQVPHPDANTSPQPEQLTLF